MIKNRYVLLASLLIALIAVNIVVSTFISDNFPRDLSALSLLLFGLVGGVFLFIDKHKAPKKVIPNKL